MKYRKNKWNFLAIKYVVIITSLLAIFGLLNTGLYAQKYEIPDKAFKKLILQFLHKPDGELTNRDFKEISKTSDLNVFGEDILSIEGIQNYVSLSSLSLNNTQVTDLTPLAGLKNLERLHISNMLITDLSPLAGLKNFSFLDISEIPITDLSIFSDLENLETLALRHTMIKDLSPLSNLLKLNSLILTSNHNVDVKSLSKWKNLEFLSISLGTMSSDSFSIDEDFGDVEPLDISHISKLTNLETIFIEYPQLVNYESLNELENLKSLRLTCIDTIDMAFLGEMVSLENIELDIPGISDLNPLSGLENLKSLKIGKNNLKDISPLLGLKNLNDISFVIKSESANTINHQMTSLKKRGVILRPNSIESQCIQVLRILGSIQIAFQESNSNKNFGSWEELVSDQYIEEGFNRKNRIDGYNIAVFDVIPSQKDEVGKIVKQSTFKIVAVPSDPSYSLHIQAIDDSQSPLKWIGDDSSWDINNINLSDDNLWEAYLAGY